MRTEAIAAMRTYYGARQRSVDHTLAVLGYAEKILEGEGITGPYERQVVVLAAIMHDVGIPAALAKYGSVTHRQQEEEGVPVTREILTGLGVRPDILERVCYIVGHHHTAEAVDGPDFQVVWEADALVNIPAKNPTPDAAQVEDLIRPVFKTPTGTSLIHEVLGR